MLGFYNQTVHKHNSYSTNLVSLSVLRVTQENSRFAHLSNAWDTLLRDASSGVKYTGKEIPDTVFLSEKLRHVTARALQSLEEQNMQHCLGAMRRHSHDAMREKVGRVRVQLWVSVS